MWSKRLAALGLVVLVSGCASKSEPPPNSYWRVRAPEPAVAAAQPKVELEEDGLPAQPPPPRRIRDMPDDPSEPWSRNYGRGRSVKQAGAEPPPASIRPEPASRATAPPHPRAASSSWPAAVQPAQPAPAVRRQLSSASGE